MDGVKKGNPNSSAGSPSASGSRQGGSKVKQYLPTGPVKPEAGRGGQKG